MTNDVQEMMYGDLTTLVDQCWISFQIRVQAESESTLGPKVKSFPKLWQFSYKRHRDAMSSSLLSSCASSERM